MGNFRKSIFTIIFLLQVLGVQQSLNALEQAKVPSNMAALGDSITAAAIASMNRDDGEHHVLFPKFIWTLLKFGYTKSIGAFENRKLSWATGWSKDIDSHSKRLAYLLEESENKKLQYFNAAVSGAKSTDLSEQVQKVLEWSKNNLSRDQAPAYVVLEIGANDACADDVESMTPVNVYRKNIESALTTLLAKNKDSKIMLSSMPNLEHLRDVARESAVAGVPFVKKCQDMWKVHKFCKNMLEEEDPEKRKLVMQRVSSYMHELEELTDSLNEKWGADHVRFSEGVFAFNFSDKDLSIDCFHPNISGQQAISDMTWQDTWWAQ